MVNPVTVGAAGVGVGEGVVGVVGDDLLPHPERKSTSTPSPNSLCIRLVLPVMEERRKSSHQSGTTRGLAERLSGVAIFCHLAVLSDSPQLFIVEQRSILSLPYI